MRSSLYRFSDVLSRYFRTDMRFFLSGGFWLTGLQVIGLLGGLATTIAFTRLLDPSTYGTYKYLIGLGVLLSTFSLSGINQSVQQTAIKSLFDFFPFAIRKSAIFSLGITISSAIIGGYYLFRGEQTLALGCLIIGILVPLATIFQNIVFFLLGRKKFKTVTTFQGFDTLISTIVLVAVLLITKNVLLLLFTYLFLQFLGNFIEYILYRPRTTTETPADLKKKYYAYGWHTTLRGIIFNIAFRLDTIVVFTHLGATDLAIYSIATLLPEQIKASFKSLSSLLLVRYAKHDDLSIVKKTVAMRSLQLLFVLLLTTAAYILCAPFIYHLLFPAYGSSVFYSQIAALTFPAYISTIPISALQAHIKEKELYYLNTINAVVLLLSVIVLTYAFGLIGAIMAKIVYRYISMLMTYYQFLKAAPSSRS